jgi:hypothetical protein
MKRTVWIAVLLCALPACAALAQQIVLSTYAGGSKSDVLTGAAVLPDGAIVIGGTVDAGRGGNKGEKLEGGQGIVSILSKSGPLVAQQKFPGTINDLDADAQGNIYVTGSTGSAKLDKSLKKPLWSSNVGGAEARIAPGPDGSAVILSGKQITLIDARGKTTGNFSVSGQYLNDVACEPKLRLIFVCGFDNKHGTPPGQKNYPVQVAFVRAYDFSGKQAWGAYGWGGQNVADLQLMADTRAYRIALGGDGKLYVAGESAGGNTMWARSSLDLKQNAGLAKGDAFQNAYNTRANHITAVVRLDPKTGQSEAGTLLLARLGNGRGNTIRPRAIAADAKGNVYVGGASAFSPPKTPGSFGREGGGAYFVIFDANFKRLYATTLAGDGTTQAIAAGQGSIIAVGDCKKELATHKPLKAEGDDNGDGFTVLLSTGAK